MTNYGKNFGFRRSLGDTAIREGKYLVPADATDWRQGIMVEIDFANPGYLKKSASGAKPEAGIRGLLIQEEGWNSSIFEGPQNDIHDMGFIRPGMRATIWSGAGFLIWLKNTPAEARTGRNIVARTVVGPGLVVGDTVQWDGDKYVKSTAAANVFAKATISSGDAGSEYVELAFIS